MFPAPRTCFAYSHTYDGNSSARCGQDSIGYSGAVRKSVRRRAAKQRNAVSNGSTPGTFSSTFQVKALMQEGERRKKKPNTVPSGGIPTRLQMNRMKTTFLRFLIQSGWDNHCSVHKIEVHGTAA